MSNPSDTNGTGSPKVERDTDFDAEASTGTPQGDGHGHGHADHGHAPAAKKPMPEWQLGVLAVLAIVSVFFWPVWIATVGLALYWWLAPGMTKGDVVKLGAGAAALLVANKEHGASHGGDSHGHDAGHGGKAAGLLNLIFPPPPQINPNMMGIIVKPPHGTTGIHHVEAGMTHVIMNLRTKAIYPDGEGCLVPGGTPVRQGHMIAAMRGIAECVAVVDHSDQKGQMTGVALNPGGFAVVADLGYSVKPLMTNDHVSAETCMALLTKIDQPLKAFAEQQVRTAVQNACTGKSISWIMDAANFAYIAGVATAAFREALLKYGIDGEVVVENLTNPVIAQARAVKALVDDGVDPDVAATIAAGHDPTGGGFGAVLGVQKAAGTGSQPRTGSRPFVVKGKPGGKGSSGKKDD